MKRRHCEKEYQAFKRQFDSPDDVPPKSTGVYVDEFKRWVPSTPIECFKAGSSHLTAESVEELHEFAKSIGLKRKWFQDHPTHPHYDLTRSRRSLALRKGAVYIPAKAQARVRMAKRKRGSK